MNRLTDAMKRAHGAIQLPANNPTPSSGDEAFTAEEAATRPAPSREEARSSGEPVVQPRDRGVPPRGNGKPPTETLSRVPPSAGGQRVRQNDAGHGSRHNTTPMEWSAVNAKVVERVATPGGAPPMMTEEYRRIAAVLHHAQISNGTKVLMVTSACPSEGKTLTACNLALTLSQSYERRVLLIDMDLRKPAVHDLFDLKNTAGLLDVLRNDKKGQDRTVPVVQVSPRLQLLLTGGVPPDPVSLLTSDALRSLVKESSEAFDWVIIDTPPAAFLPDCKLLSTLVDAAMLVVRAFVTPYPLVQQVVDAVGHDKIVGVVLNHAEHVQGGGGYYYYNYGYYGQYGGGYYGAQPTR
jgi:protein-tyrosine kinase